MSTALARRPNGQGSLALEAGSTNKYIFRLRVKGKQYTRRFTSPTREEADSLVVDLLKQLHDNAERLDTVRKRKWDQEKGVASEPGPDYSGSAKRAARYFALMEQCAHVIRPTGFILLMPGPLLVEPDLWLHPSYGSLNWKTREVLESRLVLVDRDPVLTKRFTEKWPLAQVHTGELSDVMATLPTNAFVAGHIDMCTTADSPEARTVYAHVRRLWKYSTGIAITVENGRSSSVVALGGTLAVMRRYLPEFTWGEPYAYKSNASPMHCFVGHRGTLFQYPEDKNNVSR